MSKVCVVNTNLQLPFIPCSFDPKVESGVLLFDLFEFRLMDATLPLTVR